MEINDLLKLGDQRVIEISKLMGELEDFEKIINIGHKSEIAFTENGIETTYIRVLSPEKLDELKVTVVKAITDAQAAKTAELEKLLGIRKPATINPDFEKAIQEMEQQCKPEPKGEPVEVKPEITVKAVKKMYLDEGKTLTEVANYFGVKKPMMNSFISRNGLNRSSYSKDDGFRDKEVEAKRKERP